jgi:sugar lactone lactonase YvrE
VLGLACTWTVACALVAGLEDKEAYPGGAQGGSVEASDGPTDGSISMLEAGPIGITQVFAMGQGKPWGIAVDDAFVYWTNEGDETVVRAPKSGGALTVLAHDQLEPHEILVDGTNILWHNTNLANRPYVDGGDAGDFLEIADVPKGSIGKDAGPIRVETTRTQSRLRDLSIAKTADNQLWTAYDARITRYQRSSPLGQKNVAMALIGKLPSAVAVDDLNVYWFLQQPSELWQASKHFDDGGDVGAVRATFPGTPEIGHMVADGTALYMVSTGGSLIKLPTGGDAGAQEIATGHAFPKGLTQDEKYVYFTRTSADDAAGQGLVVMVSKTGDETKVVAQGLNKPRGIAVDIALDGSRTVYWATYGDGMIRRVRVR